MHLHTNMFIVFLGPLVLTICNRVSSTLPERCDISHLECVRVHLHAEKDIMIFDDYLTPHTIETPCIVLQGPFPQSNGWCLLAPP